VTIGMILPTARIKFQQYISTIADPAVPSISLIPLF
jgi:hypothetical protein